MSSMRIDIDENFIVDYLAAASDINLATGFWNTYNNKPFALIEARQYWLLRDFLFSLLTECKKIDANAFAKIHKGHPFYFIGITSFLMEDFQTAVYFFDASMTEDFNAGADPKGRAKPSTRFLMMEGEVEGHAAQPLAAVAKAQVERAIKEYLKCTLRSGQELKLGIKEVRSNFIYRSLIAKNKPGLRTLATAFISYFIEWDFRNKHFEYGVKQGTAEPFFSHLFRGCVLLESLLKHNPTIPVMGRLLYGMLTQPDIREALDITAVQGKGVDSTLDDVFQELQNPVTTMDQTMQVAYRARNILGHNLGWDSNINQEQYQKLYFIIAASCLHVIACLWK
jgi:hypothetical protein